MSRKNRQRAQERDDDRDDDDVGARDRAAASGNRLLAIGAGLLAIGFVAGYVVGSDQGSRGSAGLPAAPFANAPFAQGAMGAGEGAASAGAPSSALAGGDLAPAVLPPPHKGHTFTGQVNVPPHSEEAHQLADTLIAGITCPCGGCQNMKLGECGCDTAKEVGGYAAHLLERGKHGDEVLKQLEPRYGFTVDESLLARAKGVFLANAAAAEMPPAGGDASAAPVPGDNGVGALAALAGGGATVQRLVDVPSSARPGAGTPGAISGTIDLAPALRAKMPASATLFIFAKSQPGGGPPMAVLREPIDGSTKFPIAFSLSQANVMMPGMTLAGSVWVTARIDVDGVAGAGPGDMEGVTPSAVEVGRNDVKVTIDTVR